MPTPIKINIVGLAACFFRDGYWNIVFVCDDVHPVRFGYTSPSGPQTTDLHEKGRDLRVDLHSNFDGRVGDPSGTNSAWVFNMAGTYAHGPRTLRIERRKAITDIVWMRIPEAVLSVTQLTPNNYFVQDLAYAGAPVQVINPVASEIVLAFSVSSDLSVVISDPKDASYSRKFEFKAQGTQVDLYLDNDCYSNCNHNDFVDLYEFLIDDSKGAERRFAAGQVKPTLIGFGHHDFIVDKMAPSPQYGNCDPVVIDPPPDGP